jgi:spermidine/putrescine transport system permease protein
MVFFSFNESKSTSVFTGFSLKWYLELFSSSDTVNALRNTLILAVCSAVLATLIGTVAAIGVYQLRSKWIRQSILLVNDIPMMNPDIVTGVSLMLMFVFMKVPLGKSTMLMAHIAFDTPYVLFSVMPRLKQMNPNLYEAALDLGCHPIKALFKVILPEIMPGVVTGSLLAFTMSLDDFVISYFTSSTDQNLSMIVYSAARRGIEPTMYALSTIMFVVILILLLAVNRRTNLEELR